MKVYDLIKQLQSMPQDIEVEVNDNNGGEVYSIEEITLYIPNIDLWPDDVAAVILQVNS